MTILALWGGFLLVALGYLIGRWHGVIVERNHLWDLLDEAQQKREEAERSRERSETGESLW